ncbi:potassium channel family protein [Nocardia otitidiscaviarum]|uniref:potassium channel family protein n=1 Tax=Nocardia otitidiscaviarum TaxID=1823 RepID=UPI002B4B14D8|nr:ion channel [Nocardia otitidiscaviarum]
MIGKDSHASSGPEFGDRVANWERRAEIPMLLFAVAFLLAYAWPVLDPALDTDLRTSLDVLSWTVWGAFAVDFAIRLFLAERRGRYALRRWYDVALLVLPMLRAFRLLRVLAVMRLLNRSVVGSLAGRASMYVTGAAVLTVFLGAIAVLDAEQVAPGTRITNFGDALWWASVTVTTVGYGDHYPVTWQGRLLAVGLMIVGIAVVGVVTAAVASWFITNVQRETEFDDR